MDKAAHLLMLWMRIVPRQPFPVIKRGYQYQIIRASGLQKIHTHLHILKAWHNSHERLEHLAYFGCVGFILYFVANHMPNHRYPSKTNYCAVFNRCYSLYQIINDMKIERTKKNAPRPYPLILCCLGTSYNVIVYILSGGDVVTAAFIFCAGIIPLVPLLGAQSYHRKKNKVKRNICYGLFVMQLILSTLYVIAWLNTR